MLHDADDVSCFVILQANMEPTGQHKVAAAPSGEWDAKHEEVGCAETIHGTKVTSREMRKCFWLIKSNLRCLGV